MEAKKVLGTTVYLLKPSHCVNFDLALKTVPYMLFTQ